MARIRSLTARLGDAFEASPFPAYILDDGRRVVFGNPAFFAWTGLTVEQAWGGRCDYGQPPTAECGVDLSGLCPPPDILAGPPGAHSGPPHVRPEECVISCRTAAGGLSRRRALVVPLGGGDSDTAGDVLVLVDPLELPSAEATGPQAARYPAPHQESRELHDRLARLRSQIGNCYRPEHLLGESIVARRIREQVRVAAAGRARTLVIGPPGSGREQVARTIHYASQTDSTAPLLVLAGPVLDREMLHSTIRAFLKRGADSTGYRLSASLLLTDADQLPPDAQTELAGFLNLPTFDLRILSTARQSLVQLARSRDFREDLAQALSTVVIELPPLRERPRDLPLLAQHFVELANQGASRQLSGLAPETLDRLAAYPWPGNMNELATTIDEACRRAEGPLVHPADLPTRLQLATGTRVRTRTPDETIRLDEFLLEVEKELLQRALKMTKGNKAKAARLLGIHRARLIRRVSQLGLEESVGISPVPFEPLEEPTDRSQDPS